MFAWWIQYFTELFVKSRRPAVVGWKLKQNINWCTKSKHKDNISARIPRKNFLSYFIYILCWMCVRCQVLIIWMHTHSCTDPSNYTSHTYLTWKKGVERMYVQCTLMEGKKKFMFSTKRMYYIMSMYRFIWKQYVWEILDRVANWKIHIWNEVLNSKWCLGLTYWFF